MADDPLEPLTTPRLDAIRAPLPGDAPAGVDMKYEDDFQELKGMVDALGAATGDVDFEGIVDLASAILSERSKDIAVAGYLVLGLTRTDGYPGIAEGVAAVRAVTEGFWEEAFPPLRRMRGRQAALQFVAERTSAWVQNNRAEPDDRDALQHAEAEVSALQAFVMEAMGEDAPAFSGLLREIREAARRLPKPAAPEPPPEEPAADATPAESGTTSADAPASPPTAVGSSSPPPTASAPPSGEVGSRSEAESQIFQLAGYFREQSATSAVPFLLQRAILWADLAEPPASGFLPAPLPHRREGLETMASAGDHALLLAEAENEFTQNPFWLDLQRYVATALQGMGPPAAAARAAVEESAAALVRRFPGLPSLTFDDGTLAADPLTTTWLSDLAAAGGGGPVSASDEAVREAQAQAAAGDVPGAVAALMDGAGAPRDRFDRAVAAAELCFAAGRADVALGLLDGADAAIQTYGLDVWDPPAAARALRLIHACCGSLKTAPASPQRVTALTDRADQAFDRLARLDPAHALRSTPAPETGP